MFGQGGIGLRLELGEQASVERRPQDGRLPRTRERRHVARGPAEADQTRDGGAGDPESGGDAVVGVASIHRSQDPLAQIAGVGFHATSMPQRQLLRPPL